MVEPVDRALTCRSPVGVDRELAGRPSRLTRLNERSALPERAEAVLLKAHEYCCRVVVEDHGCIDVRWRDPGAVEQCLTDKGSARVPIAKGPGVAEVVGKAIVP